VSAAVLVWDDVGAGSLTDFERRVLLELLDARVNGLRPMIITSNWLFGEISEKMDDRIASRLATFTQI
jgi:DNA replication protein DnaC